MKEEVKEQKINRNKIQKADPEQFKKEMTMVTVMLSGQFSEEKASSLLPPLNYKKEDLEFKGNIEKIKTPNFSSTLLKQQENLISSKKIKQINIALDLIKNEKTLKNISNVNIKKLFVEIQKPNFERVLSQKQKQTVLAIEIETINTNLNFIDGDKTLTNVPNVNIKKVFTEIKELNTEEILSKEQKQTILIKEIKSINTELNFIKRKKTLEDVPNVNIKKLFVEVQQPDFERVLSQKQKQTVLATEIETINTGLNFINGDKTLEDVPNVNIKKVFTEIKELNIEEILSKEQKQTILIKEIKSINTELNFIKREKTLEDVPNVNIKKLFMEVQKPNIEATLSEKRVQQFFNMEIQRLITELNLIKGKNTLEDIPNVEIKKMFEKIQQFDVEATLSETKVQQFSNIEIQKLLTELNLIKSEKTLRNVSNINIKKLFVEIGHCNLKRILLQKQEQSLLSTRIKKINIELNAPKYEKTLQVVLNMEIKPIKDISITQNSDSTYKQVIDWDILKRNWEKYMQLQLRIKPKSENIEYPKPPKPLNIMKLWKKMGGVEAIQNDLIALRK